jgi:hypothetical protein
MGKQIRIGLRCNDFWQCWKNDDPQTVGAQGFAGPVMRLWYGGKETNRFCGDERRRVWGSRYALDCVTAIFVLVEKMTTLNPLGRKGLREAL